MKDTIIVNLFGGPGVSKSTTAAGIFSLLKLHGVDSELVTEFAKDLVWEERMKTIKNQTYIFGKQNHKLYRVNGVVDVVVTDSPLLLGLIYDKEENEELRALIIKTFNSYNNMNFLLRRVKPFNPNGRLQTEEKAMELDSKIRTMIGANAEYITLNGKYDAINTITYIILNLLNIKQKYNIVKKLDI